MSYSVVVGHVMAYLKCDKCKLFFLSEFHYNSHPCARIIEPTLDEIEECKRIDLKYEPPKIIEPETTEIKPELNFVACGRALKKWDRQLKKHLNPPCPECGGKTHVKGTVVTKKKGKRRVFLCTKCACTFRLPYVHPDIIAMEITGVKAQ